MKTANRKLAKANLARDDAATARRAIRPIGIRGTTRMLTLLADPVVLRIGLTLTTRGAASVERVAAGCNVTPSVAADHLRRLIDLGMVEWVPAGAMFRLAAGHPAAAVLKTIEEVA